MILNGTVTDLSGDVSGPQFSFYTNCYWVTIKTMKGKVVFQREAGVVGSQWLDKKHRKITNALDALEKALLEAAIEED